MAKLLTDASYTKRDKIQEIKDGKPGYRDLTPKGPTLLEVPVEPVKLTPAEIKAVKDTLKADLKAELAKEALEEAK